jgi:AraC family transcriptional regulator
MANHFHLNEAPSLTAKSAQGSFVAVTRLKSRVALHDLTRNIPAEKAFVIPVHLSPRSNWGCETWVEGDHFRLPSWPAGGIGVYDLESNPVWRITSTFDCVQFYLPRATLNAFTDDSELTRVDTLTSVQGVSDPLLHHFAKLIVPFLDTRDVIGQLFLDQFWRVFCAHLVERYSKVAQLNSVRYRGGLAPWQKRRVTELVREHLDDNLSLAAIAAECRLSVSHFARSFKKSFGIPLHRYLILQCIEAAKSPSRQVAKSLLSRSESSLSDVVLQVGFSDQAAFCRSFTRVVGTSPGRWRREVIYSKSAVADFQDRLIATTSRRRFIPRIRIDIPASVHTGRPQSSPVPDPSAQCMWPSSNKDQGPAEIPSEHR